MFETALQCVDREAIPTCLEEDRAQVNLDEGFELGIVLGQPQLEEHPVQKLDLTHGRAKHRSVFNV